MSTDIARPARVAIIGASGTYGSGILARAEEIGVEAVVVTRSPHRFPEPKPTTRVVETRLDEEEKLIEAFQGCDGVISALGDDRKERPKTRYLPHVWRAMKAAGVTRYIGICLYCVAASEWDGLAPQVSSGPQGTLPARN